MSEKLQRRLQSVEVAADILESLIASGTSKSLKEIATAAQMTSAKVFPYLVSLTRAGLVSKDEKSGLYSAGALSQELGILGLHYLNPQREGERATRLLAETTGHGVALSVWGNHGPTVISFTEPPHTLYTEIRLGSVMSLSGSSIGRTFCAWMPADIISNAYKSATGQALSKAKREEFPLIRSRGVDMQHDTPVPGISSVSAPVFESSGAIYFALTLFDETRMLNLAANSPTIALLRQQAAALSEGLGFKP
ncbi:IclR family transcriptional regulator [Klebsiella quasivariicola]|uniref:IclR family transcriptional regulator n=1 Tax=Klebsiella quasivariicola TaxID=2026240 RepID=UPI002478F8D8|nr:helix-turn-helix domain-containing protein [Klebsiella quasivariicola]